MKLENYDFYERKSANLQICPFKYLSIPWVWLLFQVQEVLGRYWGLILIKIVSPDDSLIYAWFMRDIIQLVEL